MLKLLRTIARSVCLLTLQTPPKYLLHHLNYSILIFPYIALLLTSNSVEPCNPLGHRCLDAALECNTWQNSYTDHSVGVEITCTNFYSWYLPALGI